jgi:hypothetical protein
LIDINLREQIISGIDLATYNTDLATNEETLKTSIASCMTGVSPTNIINLVVIAGSRRRLSNHNDIALMSSVSAAYTVSVTGAGLSYDTLSTELKTSVEGGQFNIYLHDTAILYGATDLSTASSSTVNTINKTPSSSSSSSLSGGAIAGIVIAVIVCILLIGGFVFYFTNAQKHEDPVSLKQNGMNIDNPVYKSGRDDVEMTSFENVARDQLKSGKSKKKNVPTLE